MFSHNSLIITVREGGLEPPHPYERTHLKRMRLPFRHSRLQFRKKRKGKSVWLLRNSFWIGEQKISSKTEFATARRINRWGIKYPLELGLS